MLKPLLVDQLKNLKGLYLIQEEKTSTKKAFFKNNITRRNSIVFGFALGVVRTDCFECKGAVAGSVFCYSSFRS